jgi:hypothetical protein
MEWLVVGAPVLYLLHVSASLACAYQLSTISTDVRHLRFLAWGINVYGRETGTPADFQDIVEADLYLGILSNLLEKAFPPITPITRDL